MNYPVFLEIGPVRVYYHGLFLALAMFLGTFLFWRRARRDGFDEGKILDLALMSLVSALVGARMVFVLSNFSTFRGDPLDIFRSFNSGLSLFGGFVFGAWGAAFFIRQAGWSFLKLTDLSVPALAFGQGVGTIGLLLSGLATSIAGGEISAYFLLFFLLTVLERRGFSASSLGKSSMDSLRLVLDRFGLRRTGFLTFLYLFLAGAIRLVSSFYRVMGGGWGIDRLSSILGMVIGGWFLGRGLFLGGGNHRLCERCWNKIKPERFKERKTHAQETSL